MIRRTSEQANPRGITTWSMTLLGIMPLALAVAAATAWVLQSYMGVLVPASLIFGGNDGWCDPSSAGLGCHCWGDYAQFSQLRAGLDASGPGTNSLIPVYPPISRFFILTFLIIGRVLGTHTSLIFYLFMASLALVVPALWAGRYRPWPLKLLLLAVLGIGTYPFIATMDRGNNLAFMVPLLLVFVVAFARQQWLTASISIVLLCQFKPQFLLLVFALLAVREYRRAAGTAAATIALFLVSFLPFSIPVFGMSASDELRTWFDLILRVGQSQPIDSSYPINVSFARIAYLGTNLLGLNLPDSFIVSLGMGLALTLMGMVVLLGRRIPPLLVAIIAMSSSAFLSGVVAPYYLVISLPVAAVIIRETSRRPTPTDPLEFIGDLDVQPSSGPMTAVKFLMLAAVVASLTPLLIPYGALSQETAQPESVMLVYSLVPLLASALWIGVSVATIVLGIRNRANHTPSDETRVLSPS